MELHRLPSLPYLAAHGQARAVVNPRPRTVQQVLDDARRAMDMEDAYQDWLAGRSVPQLRRPRKSLRAWLFGEPAVPPNVGVSEVVPVWPDGE